MECEAEQLAELVAILEEMIAITEMMLAIETAAAATLARVSATAARAACQNTSGYQRATTPTESLMYRNFRIRCCKRMTELVNRITPDPAPELD